jgi:hypothetical protein
MANWTITRTDSTDILRTGTAPSLAEAWAQTIEAVMDELTGDSTLNGCAMAVDATPGLLLAGRTATGELDLHSTRAAAERLALACAGGQFLTTRGD